ncbi:MAG: di-trans,poly-cis-decaprenylcistransferase [Bacilli bacterium]|nr:di-trans,poly-cis-decaprenylcistransferase [Bacilli bacterium]
MDNVKMPIHLGIIMDGNGRWATERGLARTEGHREGANTLKELVLYTNKIGIKYLSVYAFSTENFKRSKQEVDFLMNLFTTLFKSEFDEINRNNIKVIFSGRRDNLSTKVLDVMDSLVEKTSNNTGMTLNICLNYGSRAEIVDMSKKLCTLYKNNQISLDDIDEEYISKNLYNDLPDIDLLIRTSGEIRLSNFMLYQLSYAELYFPNTYFPDFHSDELDKAIEIFNDRDRRYGGIK